MRFSAILLMAALLCATGSFGAEGPRPTKDRPNIVLIMADDLGYECLGSYGSASYATPNLDRMAEKGMRFTQCHAQPLCTPSRVKIMTGRYNFRNYTAFGVLPPEEITFGPLMKEAGYATCLAGKWQLYGHDVRQYKSAGLGTHPDDAGFDEYLLWQVTKQKWAGERYANPLLLRNGEEARSYEDAYGPEVFTDYIEDFMERHREKPFFVYYPMCLPHGPFVPTPDSDGWAGNRYKRDTKYFKDMVEYMDKIVGRIIAKIDDLGISENTLVLFTGDNGTATKITSQLRDGRTIKGNKEFTNDAGTHVPLIALWPGAVPAGAVNNDLIDFSDFLPTMTDFANAKLPDDRILDGVSFAPQLQGQPGTPREWLFCSYEPRWGTEIKTRFVHDGRWKLYDDGRFYNLQVDPEEREPLDALDPQAEEVRSGFQQALDSIQ